MAVLDEKDRVTRNSLRAAGDPTESATGHLDRGLNNLRDLLSTRIDAILQVSSSEARGLLKIIETRIDAMDKATALLRENISVVPSEMDRQVTHLREFMVARIESTQVARDERFHSIDLQFRERDTRTDQSSRDSKVAVDAALQAAKEAVGEQNKSSALAIAKSETSTTKQIDQLQTLIQTNNDATNDKINDIKARLDRGEGLTRGGDQNRSEKRLDSGLAAAIAGVCVTMLSVAVAIGLFALKHS
jgi:hypothetical protein